MLYSGAWKSAHFKKYNFESEGIYPNCGALHPLLKVREEMRNIFLEMGLVAADSSTCCQSDQSISHSSALLRCQHPLSSSLVSGVSMHFLFHNNIRHATYRIHSTSLTRSPHSPRPVITMSEFPESTNTAALVRSAIALRGLTPSHTNSFSARTLPHLRRIYCTSSQHGVVGKR